jgi:molybdate transport system substrate-binding protein
MKWKRCITFLGTAIASLLLVIGANLLKPTPVQANTNLRVSAATSLKDVMADIKPLYQKKNPSVTLTFNFGAAGALLQQIEQGAPADIFISAANQQMDTLQKKGDLLPGTRSNLAYNRLVLITAKGSTNVTSFASLKHSAVKRIAIGEPRSSPAGQYAEQVLKNLTLWEAVKPKLVYANTVRQILASVESGNVDAGFVYFTDAKISDKVKMVATANESTHSPIVYPMAVLKASKQPTPAKAFVRYLSGHEARSILRKYGFIVR